jgi:hypothetical protein
MRRLLVIALALVGSLVAASPVAAQTRTLWPGVIYETTVQFRPNGPVVLHVLTGPRPGGLTALTPVLSNETVVGRETLTSMQRRLAGTATTAGVNGDLFALSTGRPSGIVIRDGVLQTPPSNGRSSAGILADGTLDVRRVVFQGTWQGAGAARPLVRLNAAPPASGAALFTSAYGPQTPPLPGATAVVLFPFPLAAPGIDLPATAAELVSAATPVGIPPGGAVLLARGAAAAAVTAEVAPGSTVNVRLGLTPDWPGVVGAIGGGPQLVRGGKPVFRAGELFTAGQLNTRAPRSAVGQTADGRILLVAVDGRQAGYSVGVTNFELAQALVRLGATTAMALDGGGSTTMAFDGTVLNRPSGVGERAIASALLLTYTGVFVTPPPAVVSPDGDGVDDAPRLSYRLTRPATVTIKLTAPDGTMAATETVERLAGSYPVAFPAAATGVAAGAAAADGRWTLLVDATDDLGQASSMSQSFVVNTTLGFLRVGRTLFLPPGGRDHPITFRLAHAARVVVTVETGSGVLVRTLARRSYPVGEVALAWNGIRSDRKPVVGGRYVVRVVARNAAGAVTQVKPLLVRRVRG